MKAISLHQPWASLIAAGIKTVETRSWKPPDALIGQRIAIHAAKRKITGQYQWFNAFAVAVKAIGPNGASDCPLGMVVATAVLRKAVKVERVQDGKAYWKGYFHEGSIPMDTYGDFTPGRWLWFLKDIERLPEPIPATGHQGFWNLDISDTERAA